MFASTNFHHFIKELEEHMYVMRAWNVICFDSLKYSFLKRKFISSYILYVCVAEIKYVYI